MTPLVEAIEQHCAANGISISRFGQQASNDPGLVRTMRAGRTPKKLLRERIDRILRGQAVGEARWTDHGLISRVEQHCRARGISLGSFGAQTLGDPMLIEGLRNGRRLRAKTRQRVESALKRKSLRSSWPDDRPNASFAALMMVLEDLPADQRKRSLAALKARTSSVIFAPVIAAIEAGATEAVMTWDALHAMCDLVREVHHVGTRRQSAEASA